MTTIQPSNATRENLAAKMAEVRARTAEFQAMKSRSPKTSVVLDYKPTVVKVDIPLRSEASWRAQDARMNGPVSEDKGWSGGEMKGLTAEQIERRIGSIRSVLNDKNATGLKFVGMNGDQKTTSPQEFLSWLEGAYAKLTVTTSRVA